MAILGSVDNWPKLPTCRGLSAASMDPADKPRDVGLEMNGNDEAARSKALDVKQSFIVRSPAGSGKTQLLTLRFLALLGKAEKDPEEVLAITFTRKAAAEMRERILHALIHANDPVENSDPLFLQTRQLARQVLLRDGQENWHLLENPGRLKIQTIDSFCAWLTRQMPIASHFSAYSQIVENPRALYLRAARETLNEIDRQEEWSPAIEQLLLHLDNAHEKIENLLADMLARRDQWMRYLGEVQTTSRSRLEEGLVHIIQQHLGQVAAQFPKSSQEEMLVLLRYAASQLNSDHLLNSFLEQDQFPGSVIKDYSLWKTIADFCLTTEGQWRKVLTQKQGFPAQSKSNPIAKEMKERALEMLSALAGNELLRELLEELTFLPPPDYSDQQWSSVTAWLKIFPLLLAHLKIIFQQEGVTDYVEVALNALNALGDADAPSDLTLWLDQQIRHILVDEFQDTSFSQYGLLEKMVAGWQPGDGRTLFLVGDPMQSIYRFRKAEVGLFLKVAKEGIGPVSLELLTLQMNFRSQADLVNWTNEMFSPLMSLEDLSSGAIQFNASIPTKNAQMDPLAVKWYPLLNADDALQATQVIDIIRSIFAHQPQSKIAILVRAKSHAQAILPLLREANMAYQATELEALESRPVIRDLLALTRAFLNPADRIAWLSVLRAPWCGLILADLYKIAGIETEQTIWERIVNIPLLELNQDGEARLTYFVTVMKHNLQQRGSLSLRMAIEKIWHELNGTACLTDPNEQQNSKVFFDVLDELEVAGDILDVNELEQRLSWQYATSVFPADSACVEVMTLHKAKGLEFDHVILPALERKTTQDDPQLLLWSEYIGLHQRSHLILGPIKGVESEADAIHQYLTRQETKKAQHEMLRLFYVAVTRAKQGLHLIGSVTCDMQEKIKKPPKESFLGQIWPNAETIFTQALAEKSMHQNLVEKAKSQATHSLKRLKSDFFISPALSFEGRHCEQDAKQSSKNESRQLEQINYSLKQHLVQSIGTVIHQQFQYLNCLNFEKSFERAAVQQALLALGVSLTDIDQGIDWVERAIKNTLVCERGRWIFSLEHREISSEYPLSYLDQNRLRTYIIDRTFIDQQGTRWIIDFKTHISPVENLDIFLSDQKQLYRAQLEQYAKLMRKLDDRPIRVGLYFPLQSAWVEWEPLLHTDKSYKISAIHP